MPTIALISCTKRKKTYRCKASEMYAASPWFKLAYELATLVADRVYILSAMHGLLPAEREIDPYDEALQDKPLQERRQWHERVVESLGGVSDMSQDDFVIMAGRDYYENLLPHLKRVWLPLKGKELYHWPIELATLLILEKSNIQAEILHLLFNSLPRFDWEGIKDIPFNNGIYIIFEQGETYGGKKRIVRVGTHRSQGRLKGRLQDHFMKEDADGSIFRKNIGRALLYKDRDPYLKVWEIDMSNPANKTKYAHLIDEQRDAELESQVTQYLRENISFTCFPVYEKEERLRLEEGIIATLNRSDSFFPGKNWLGSSSPMSDIAASGLWNREGLDGSPLTMEEMRRIKWLCRYGNDFYFLRNRTGVNRSKVKQEVAPAAPLREEAAPSSKELSQYMAGQAGGKYGKLGSYLRGVSGSHVKLSYQEIEDILGSSLPDSAHKHRPWWGNGGGHVQAEAWLSAGWRVGSVELGRAVEFLRQT